MPIVTPSAFRLTFSVAKIHAAYVRAARMVKKIPKLLPTAQRIVFFLGGLPVKTATQRGTITIAMFSISEQVPESIRRSHTFQMTYKLFISSFEKRNDVPRAINTNVSNTCL